jgi:hypothetical protein
MDHKRLRAIMAVVIGVCIGVTTFIHLQRSESTAEKLVQTSKDLNTRLPVNVDSETRLDTTVAGPGNCLTYSYTLINASKNEIVPGDVTAKIKPKLLLNYRTSPDMKLFRDNRVTVRYIYKDKLGKLVTLIEVTPDDLWSTSRGSQPPLPLRLWFTSRADGGSTCYVRRMNQLTHRMSLANGALVGLDSVKTVR